jgi:hypothetical protein
MHPADNLAIVIGFCMGFAILVGGGIPAILIAITSKSERGDAAGMGILYIILGLMAIIGFTKLALENGYF